MPNEEQVQNLREYIKQNKAKAYPIEGHPLENASDYVKDMYLKMLCLVINYIEDIGQEQTMLMERIIQGIKASQTLETYMREANDIDDGAYQTIVDEVLINGLQYAFIGDVLVMTHLVDCKTEVVEFIAELVESLGVVDKELEYLLTVAKAVLEQDIAEFLIAKLTKPNAVPIGVLKYYFALDKDIIVNMYEDKWIFFSLNLQTINLDDYIDIQSSRFVFEHKEKVAFIGLEINLSSLQLQFSNIENVMFIGCTFVGGQNWLQFNSCQEITVIGCKFGDFNNRIFVCEDNVEKVDMKNSKFINCMHNYTDTTTSLHTVSTIVWGQNVSLSVDNCSFENCGGRNTSFAKGVSLLSNSKASIKNSVFRNCWHYHNTNNKDPESPRRLLFSNLLESRDNQVVNSADLGPR